MNRAARLRLQRLLAALLWLLASFAYITREQQMAGMPGMMMGAASAVGELQHQPQAPRITGKPEKSPSEQHAGHCPFCFTAAFALAAVPVIVVAAFSVRTPIVTVYAPFVPPVPASDTDARAPPCLNLLSLNLLSLSLYSSWAGVP